MPNLNSRYAMNGIWWEGCGAKFRPLVEHILNQVRHCEPINTLVPGVGAGRVVLDLLDRLAGDRSSDLFCIDPDPVYLNQFRRSLLDRGFECVTEAGLDVYSCYEATQGGVVQRVRLYETTIEEFLKAVDTGAPLANSVQPTKDFFDLMLFLLFFHFIPHCSVSVLKRTLDLLKTEGVVVVDCLSGADEQTRQLLPYLDEYPDRLLGLAEVASTLDPWRQYHLKRLYERSAFYGSAIKGTDVKLIRALLGNMFRREDTVRCEGNTATEFRTNGERPRLPFWWGEGETFQMTGDGIVPTVFEVMPAFDCYVYAGKAFAMVDSDKVAVAHHDLSWELCEGAIAAHAHRNLNAALPVAAADYRFSFNDANKLVSETFPLIILQLLLSNGVFDYNSAITSFFFATGFVEPDLKIPKLDKLHFAIGGENELLERRITTWKRNVLLFGQILAQPLSERFIDIGKRVAIYSELLTSGEPLRQHGFETLRIPRLESADFERLWYGQSGLKDNRRRTLWGRIVTFEQDGPVDAQFIARERSILVDRLRENVSALLRSDLNALGIQENQAHASLALNVLLTEFKYILFVPLPSFFKRDEQHYSPRSLLGLGITVDRVDDAALNEVERLVRLASTLARRFQDGYLSYRWVSLSREASVRAALASVVGRNMSHNVGSHPLDYLIHTLESGSTPENHAGFLRYVKERMDFLAEVTTHWIKVPWFEPST